MISVSGKSWIENKKNIKKIQKLSIDNNLTTNLSKFYLNRGFSIDEIMFKKKNIPEMNNFFKNNKDFLDAKNLLIKTIQNKDLTLVFGDYDVDGIASVSILLNYFKEINHPCYYIIPNRFKDGYGPNIELLRNKIRKNTKTVIFVDCGTNSNDVLDFLIKKKINILIIDHHQILNKISQNIIMINPQKNPSKYFNDNICAAALTFFLLSLFQSKLININKYIIFALLGTICDIMPMRSINRYLALKASNNFNEISNPGLKQIINLLNLKKKISYEDLSYIIGPILNSSGRIKTANISVDLLTSDNKKEIFELSKKLFHLNTLRKKIEKENMELLNKEKSNCTNQVIFIFNKNLHEGVIGIIAGKLKEKFNIPTFILTSSSKNLIKGSVRSTNNFNLKKLFCKLLQLNVIENGGGHETAGGFVVKENKLSLLQKLINKEYKKIKKINIFFYDIKLSLPKKNSIIFSEINELEPFGNKNPEPSILFQSLKILKSKVINNRHIQCILKNKTGSTIKSISFDAVNTPVGNYLLNFKKEFDLVGSINENIWNNKKTHQIIIKDLII
tara:strand:- start:96 stop:1778 length:1683 start_codon:yes stop_codon:yes gene_type:complete